MTSNLTSKLASRIAHAIRAQGIEIDGRDVEAALLDALASNTDYEVTFTSHGVGIKALEQTAADRRPAPTVDEVWAAHPEVHEKHLRALTSDEEPEQRKFALVPQPTYSPDITEADLPKNIVRQCCWGKTCGGTTLYLDVAKSPTGDSYTYLRGSNDEHHFLHASTVADLVKQLNDPAWWPNMWSPWDFEYAGKPGWSVNAPENLEELLAEYRG